MAMKNQILQAYKQAPWRLQIQWIGLFLLALVLIAAITGLYLNISAQAATSGRKIQYLESDIEDINNEIADLTTQLAKAQSTENMSARAEELGFKMIDPNNAVYLEIPGYDPNADLVLAPPRVNIIAESPIVKSSYKISLWEWFIDQIWQPTKNSTQIEEGVLP
jgi:cell division protein FtsB